MEIELEEKFIPNPIQLKLLQLGEFVMCLHPPGLGMLSILEVKGLLHYLLEIQKELFSSTLSLLSTLSCRRILLSGMITMCRFSSPIMLTTSFFFVFQFELLEFRIDREYIQWSHTWSWTFIELADGLSLAQVRFLLTRPTKVSTLFM